MAASIRSMWKLITVDCYFPSNYEFWSINGLCVKQSEAFFIPVYKNAITDHSFKFVYTSGIKSKFKDSSRYPKEKKRFDCCL